jgi:glycosyltransferase involved in cell wall biosynthesis
MKLSVFSCWHNRLHDLEPSVLSVLDQEGVEFEYVIVDDASTDGTSDRLAAIGHPRLRLIRNERNVGFTRSAIRAVEACRGEYVAVHGAGDISLPGRLAAQAAFLDANPDVVAVGARVENHNLITGEHRIHDPRRGDMSGIGMKYTHGEVMFRRAAYDQVGGYRSLFYFSQDIDLWFRMRAVGRLGAVDGLLYERRMFEDGIEADAPRKLRQAVFANLAVHAEAERAAGRRDPVDRDHALALLTQRPTDRYRHRLRRFLRPLLRQRRFADARKALDNTPSGMLGVKQLALLMLLRAFTRR